ncbi:MAG TPA: LuxR C-terminal-related transcriptional regulator [Candidatus Angelobacter sp.]
MGTAQIPLDFFVYICSRNPIAVWAIEHFLASNSFNGRFAVWLPNQLLITPPGVHVLLIDVCSISEWPEAVRKWTDAGHRTLLLTTESWSSRNPALRALHLGVRGIVHVSQGFIQQLSEAISFVARGQLFASVEILDEFYYGSRRLRPRSVTPHLSFREEQVIDLLIKGFSNRRIGTVLGISERTAKFHVCNLLRKLQVRTRRELVDKHGDVLDQHKSA